MSAFDRLIVQIDDFIRKFYKNQIIKGLILFICFVVLTYLAMVLLEYFGRFNTAVRATLFFSFITINTYILFKYIFIPLFKLKEIGSRINRYQASEIIGRFFPSVSDRLINTLQLNDQMNPNSADYELLSASVQQRSISLSALPFTDAVDFKENKRYAKWLVPILLILFSFAVFSPTILKQGTQRVVNFNQHFEVPAPFSFNLLSKTFTVDEGDDFIINLELSGESLPEKVYVKSSQGRFLLDRVSKNTFKGKLVQLKKSTHFYFEANNFTSKSYSIQVIGKSSLGKFDAYIKYPKYLGLENETISNAGDITLYEGSEVTWSALVKNSNKTSFWIDTTAYLFKTKGFTLSNIFKSDKECKVVLTNSFSLKTDTSYFSIDVIKDAFPSIEVDQIKDSIKDGVRYFSGLLSDDHGLTTLSFVYEITSDQGAKRKSIIDAGRFSGTESPFNFAVDFRRENLSLKDEINYYFIVHDNDGVNGSKSTRSRTFNYQLPSLQELNEKRDEDQKDLNNNLEDILERTSDFKNKIDKLKTENRNSKQSNWNKQDQVNQLQEDHKSLLKDLKNIQETLKNNTSEHNQLSEIDKDLLEKQELINELLDELMDDEMKDLLDQLQDLIKKQDKNALNDKLEDLDRSSEEMKNQLDRSLEMLKRLQVNEKIDAVEKELLELSKEQDNLKNTLQNKKNVSNSDLNKQNDINNKFEKIKNDLIHLDSLNNALKQPINVDMQLEKSEDVKNNLNESKEALEKNKSNKASDPQQNASDQMKQMANEMDAMQEQANQQQQQEDIDALRDILEGLIILSIDQEFTMKTMSSLSEHDPAFRTQGKFQRQIVEKTNTIRDSLLALAERQPKIARFIDKELTQIKVNHDLVLSDIGERRKRDLRIHQQYAMTSYNNLALLLNESLADMQSQMKSKMEGSGSCSKPGGKGKPSPGGGNPSPQDMKQMLKDQLEQMKKGNSPGGKSPGENNKGNNGKGGHGSMGLGNHQIAKMAAQQGVIRRKLEELRNELNKDGKGTGNQLNPLLKELEKQEQDLINKQFDNNLIDRQQRILTRLLESDKALNERGLSDKRESKEGKSKDLGNQIRFYQYNKEKLKQIELLRSVSPNYKKYYKDKANEYFNREL